MSFNGDIQREIQRNIRGILVHLVSSNMASWEFMLSIVLRCEIHRTIARVFFSKPCFRTEGTLDECHSTLTVKMMGFIMFRRPFSFSRWTDQFWIVTLITNARAVGNELGKSGDGIKL